MAWQQNLHLLLVHVLVLGRERWRSMLLSYGGLLGVNTSCRTARCNNLAKLARLGIVTWGTGDEVIVVVAVIFVVILSFLTVFDRGDACSRSVEPFLLAEGAMCRMPLHSVRLRGGLPGAQLFVP